MTSFVWAFIERIIPKFVSAGIMLLLAALLTPSIVGVYSWMILALLLVQSATDVPIRQVMILHIATPEGGRFLRNYRVLASTVGGLALAAVIGILALTQPEVARAQVIGLAPFVLVPLASALGVEAIVRLQLAGRWRTVASRQALAAIASLAVSIPVLMLTQSIAASATQALLAEALVSVTCLRAARRERPHVADLQTKRGQASVGHDFMATAGYAVLGWGQSRADVVGVGAIGGTAMLAQYSFALSLGRSATDAASTSVANVARPRLAARQGEDATGPRAVATAALFSSYWLIAGVVLATAVGVQLLRPLLDEQWAPALRCAPIIALTGFSTALGWTVTGVLQSIGAVRRAVPIRGLGLVLALPIAWASTISLEYVAWLGLVREVVIAVLLVYACGRAAPWRAAAVAVCATIGGGLAVSAFNLFLEPIW